MTDRPPIGSIVAFTTTENVSRDVNEFKIEPRVYPGRVIAYMPHTNDIVVEYHQLRTWKPDGCYFHQTMSFRRVCPRSDTPCGTAEAYGKWSPVEEAPANFGVLEFYE